jgi:hypothetical protein
MQGGLEGMGGGKMKNCGKEKYLNLKIYFSPLFLSPLTDNSSAEDFSFPSSTVGFLFCQ